MGSKKSSDGDKNSKKKNKGIAPPDHDSKAGSGMISDPRFASVHSDPRFQKVPRNKTKVEIDSRFKGVFKDKKFACSSAPVDKRGRPKKKESENFLKEFYQVEENRTKEEEDDDSEEEKKSEKSESESGDELVESDSATSSDDDEAVIYGLDDEPEGPEENVPEIEKETRRLAVVNMDWRHIKASDLYVILSSFLNENGQILSVSVYPSEFGLQRMAEEEVHGPVGLFDDKGENSSDDEDENDHESDDSSDDEDANAHDDVNENSSDDEDENDDELDDEKLPMEEEEDYSSISLDDDDDESDKENVEQIDNEKLREYEKSRMRYYYAVVECDSVATADHLYKACDGVEVARSSNMLDMRFIPDSMEFKHPPRDVATEAPSKYEGLNFQTQALQQSKIHLTWDEDEPDRAKTLKRKLNAEQLEDLELKEYLASEESESDEDDKEDVTKEVTDKKQKKRDLYKALLNSAGNNSDGDEDEEDDDAKNMEVTFSTGLEDQSKIYLEKDKKQETVWEAHLKARREKKRLRKNRSKGSSEDESGDDDREVEEESGDFFVDETMPEKKPKKSEGKGSKRAKREEDSDEEVEAATEAELELLLADDTGAGTAVKGYNLKPKKVKGKKGKKVKKTMEEDEIPPDVDDPRFSMLFTSPDFALDPTDPQFKRTGTYARQVVSRKQKHNEEFDERPYPVPAEPKVLAEERGKADDRDSNRKKYELSTEIRSVKMRCQQIKPCSNEKADKSESRDQGSKPEKMKKEKKIRDNELASMLQSVKRHGLNKKKR